MLPNRVEVERLDEALAALARREAGARLLIGQALEVMSRGSVFELGFSSSGAYALERCERGVRWAEVARGMARKMEGLPLLRHALAMGQVSWSMAELLGRVAQPGDEARWMRLAERRTVRQMRVLVAQANADHRARRQRRFSPDSPPLEEHASESGERVEEEADDDAVDMSVLANREMCTLSCTVDREDAWLFEATRYLLDQLGARGADAMEALLAEAQGSLLDGLPKGTLDLDPLLAFDEARQRWLSELARWRDDAEALCERERAGRQRSERGDGEERRVGPGAIAIAACLGMEPLEGLGCEELDATVRRLARALARHELVFARRLLAFHRVDGWRQLGYASENQYARERLGMSRSSVLARRSLAVRLEKLSGLAAALGSGDIGVEAALQLVRVATPRTEAEWIARARKRTIKHLREEVAAALAAVRWSGEADCPPPLDEEVDAFHALERAVVSGRVLLERPGPAAAGERVGASSERVGASSEGVGASSEQVGAEAEPSSSGEAPPASARRPWLVMLESLAAWLDGGQQGGPVQMSAGRRGAGRVRLSLHMPREAGAWWRRLEALARPRLARGMSWLRFACLAVWRAWRHSIGTEMAYGSVFVRDRFRCASPVCSRRDVTPHHLQFRSAGGSDDDENIGSVCTWCHLEGVHGGRIRAQGTASHIRWELGPVSAPCLVVDGRERQALSAGHPPAAGPL